MRRSVGALMLGLGVLTPSDARAEGETLLGIAAIWVAGAAIGAVVSPVGATVTTADGEPSPEWGRASLAFGSVATATGGTLLIIGAAVDEEDAKPFFVIGGVSLGVGLFGLVAGGITEAKLAEEDPGIPGRPRPSMQPSVLRFDGSF